MNRQSLLFLLLLLASSPFPAVAGDTASPGDTYKAARKEAASRYAADKKLCAEESTSSARMQCLRDAKAEHTKALAAAKQKLQAANSKPRQRAEPCADCGQVVDVTTGKKEGKGGPIGVIAGGVAGALLGHQVGGGTGKDVATIAGAAGGAYAGHKAEQKLRSTNFWSVKVRLDSGEERTFEFDHDPGVARGDLVKVSGSTIVRR